MSATFLRGDLSAVFECSNTPGGCRVTWANFWLLLQLLAAFYTRGYCHAALPCLFNSTSGCSDREPMPSSEHEKHEPFLCVDSCLETVCEPRSSSCSHRGSCCLVVHILSRGAPHLRSGLFEAMLNEFQGILIVLLSALLFFSRVTEVFIIKRLL